MKTIASIIIAVCLVASFTARACWAPISLENFVKRSHLIVVGEIQRINNAPKAKYAHDTAFIKVERILSSTAHAAPEIGSEIQLSMPAVNNEMTLSIDIRYKKGQRGIWILYFEDGKYHANHPMSLHPLAEEPKVTAAIKGKNTK